jgi:hypothetical protein
MNKKIYPMQMNDVLRSILALITLSIFAGSVTLTIACWKWLEIGELGMRSINTMSQMWNSPIIFINYMATVTLSVAIVNVARRGDKKSLRCIAEMAVIGTGICIAWGIIIGTLTGLVGGFFAGVIFKDPNWIVYGSVLGTITWGISGFLLGNAWVLAMGLTNELNEYDVKMAWR